MCCSITVSIEPLLPSQQRVPHLPCPVLPTAQRVCDVLQRTTLRCAQMCVAAHAIRTGYRACAHCIEVVTTQHYVFCRWTRERSLRRRLAALSPGAPQFFILADLLSPKLCEVGTDVVGGAQDVLCGHMDLPGQVRAVSGACVYPHIRALLLLNLVDQPCGSSLWLAVLLRLCREKCAARPVLTLWCCAGATWPSQRCRSKSIWD